MNYKRIYNELIEKRRINPVIAGYKENHHILPRALGGTNNDENMMYLTAREHYVAHLLLHKFMNCQQTAYALWMMQMKPRGDNNRIPYVKGSRMYDWARKEFTKYIGKNNSKLQQGKKNSQYGKMWICNIDLKENNKIKNTDDIPDGWIKGRNKWNEYVTTHKVVKTKKTCKECNTIFKTKTGNRYCSTKCKQKQIMKKTRYYYDLFNNGNYVSLNEFHRTGLYPNSLPALVYIFKKYIPEYNGSRGKAVSSNS